MREMTVNLTGEFFKDFSQKQDGRFPAGEVALYMHVKCIRIVIHYHSLRTGTAYDTRRTRVRRVIRRGAHAAPRRRRLELQHLPC